MPVPGYACRVVDETGREVPRGTSGPDRHQGPDRLQVLAEARAAGRVREIRGWNVTGDVYIHDDDGYFWYQCRSDDMIVTGGYKIPGPEVEHVLDEHPAVAESAVVATPDATRGFVPKAFVVLRPGFTATDELVKELQDHVKKVLAPYKYPRQITFVPVLPHTETGKLRRVELRQQEAGHAARP